MSLAPVVLFVYNRPGHTRQTLEHLTRNELAAETVLYIYADGPKETSSEEELRRVEETRSVIREKKWCGEVHIVEASLNCGLAASVIKGISEVLKKHGKVIVLEDDIVTAKGFLKFMNEGLNTYEKELSVAGISGWTFSIAQEDETFFSRIGACWGWATWKRVWDTVDFNAAALIEKLKAGDRIREFNADGAYDYYSMLNKQALGKLDSWAIRFYTNYFLKNSLFLFPDKSLVQNIGFDGTGTHYNGKASDEKKSVVFEKEEVHVAYINPIEKPAIRKKIVDSLQGPREKKSLISDFISRIKRKLS